LNDRVKHLTTMQTALKVRSFLRITAMVLGEKFVSKRVHSGMHIKLGPLKS